MPPKRAAAKSGLAARSSGRKRRKPTRIDNDEPSEPQPTSSAPATDASHEAAAMLPAVLTALTEIVNNTIDRRLAPSTSAQTRTSSTEVLSTQPAAPPTPTQPQTATPILKQNQSAGNTFASPTTAAVLAGLIDDNGESQGAPDNTQIHNTFDSIMFVSSEVRAKILKHEYFYLAQL